jgi:hypothetical protein
VGILQLGHTFKSKDGLTVPEHHEILNQIESHSLVDPGILLPRHWFLFEADFEVLGQGPTSHQLLWLVDMETAVVASNHAWAGTLSSQAIAHISQATATWVVQLHGNNTGGDEGGGKKSPQSGWSGAASF